MKKDSKINSNNLTKYASKYHAESADGQPIHFSNNYYIASSVPETFPYGIAKSWVGAPVHGFDRY